MAKSLLSDTSYNQLVDCVYEALKVDKIELGKIVSLGQRLVDTVAQSSGSLDAKKKVLFEIVEKAAERVQDSSEAVKLALYVSQLKTNLMHLLAMKSYFSLFFGACCQGPLPLEPIEVKIDQVARMLPAVPEVPTAVPEVPTAVPEVPTEVPASQPPILNVLDSSCDEPVLIVNSVPSTVVEQNPQEVVLRTPVHDLD
jgi:hypothetical protein